MFMSQRLCGRNLTLKLCGGVFLGYSRNKKAYLAQLLDTGKIVHFEHAYFDETSFPFIVGINEKWFKDQLAGPADFEAGPSDQDIRSSMSDDLVSWDEQTDSTPELNSDLNFTTVFTPVREHEISQKKNNDDFSQNLKIISELPELEPMPDSAQAMRDMCGLDNFSEDLTVRSPQSDTGRPENTVERKDSTELAVYDLPVVAEDTENEQDWMDAILGHRQITQGRHKGDYHYVVRW